MFYKKASENKLKQHKTIKIYYKKIIITLCRTSYQKTVSVQKLLNVFWVWKTVSYFKKKMFLNVVPNRL